MGAGRSHHYQRGHSLLELFDNTRLLKLCLCPTSSPYDMALEQWEHPGRTTQSFTAHQKFAHLLPAYNVF
jgi:hypothetical protein